MNKNKFFYNVLFFCFPFLLAEENVNNAEEFVSFLDNGCEIKRSGSAGIERLISAVVDDSSKESLFIRLITNGSDIDKDKDIRINTEEFEYNLKLIKIYVFYRNIALYIFLSKNNNCIIFPSVQGSIKADCVFSKKIHPVDLYRCAVSVKKKKNSDELVIKVPYFKEEELKNVARHDIPVTYEFEK